MTRIGLAEILAILATVAGLIAVPLVMAVIDGAPRAPESGSRVMEITGIGREGIWTQETVAGHNYWRREFPPATLLRAATGENLIIRIRSADVTHGFSIPELGVGPVEVEAGKVVDVPIPTGTAGRFVFACYSVCGPDHNTMVGLLEISDPESELPDLGPWPPLLPEGGDDAATARGREIVNRRHCLACHRLEGVGGSAAPDLDRSAARLRPSFVRSFLSESDRIKIRVHPGVMPDLNLAGEEVDALAQYLASVGDREYPEPPVEEPEPTAASIRSGRELVQRYGCFGCHAVGPERFEGTAPDFLPEAEMAEVRRDAPDLGNARHRLDPAWTLDFILSPKRFLPDTRMPRLVVSRTEAAAIRDFLWSLAEDPSDVDEN